MIHLYIYALKEEMGGGAQAPSGPSLDPPALENNNKLHH